MTDDEIREALKRVGEKARSEAFAAGLPIPIRRNGENIWLYEDGTTTPLENGPQIRPARAPSAPNATESTPKT